MNVYLDYAANTPVDETVLNLFYENCLKYYANPNSLHFLGRESNKIIEQNTQNILKILDLQELDLIYTSGASESNNLAIKGVARSYRQNGKHIISTFLEHSSVSGALTLLQNQGYEVDLLEINSDGTINIEHLKELIRKDTILVSISYVDSELGVVQPIEQIKNIIKEYEDCFLHVDATQAIGKTNFNFKDIDLITFAPHKFYGLNGCGVLLKRKDIILEPLINGGISSSIYRSGTPFLAMALSIEKALSTSLENFEQRTKIVEELYNKIIDELKQYPLVRINSTEKSVNYIINLSVKGIKSKEMQRLLDLEGIYVSTKSACSSPGPSRAVYAVSKDKKNATYSWRISLSHLTTNKEIDIFLQKFKKIYTELCN